MKRSFTSYQELLEEEERLQSVVDEANIRVENHFKLDLRPTKLIGLLKGFSPFSKLGKQSSNVLGFLNLDSKEEENKGNNNLIELSLDLAYQSIGLMFIKKTQKDKLNSEESSAKTSIKLILKSIADNLYFQNKEKIVSAVNQLINKNKENPKS